MAGELPGFVALLRGRLGDGSYVVQPGESAESFAEQPGGVIRDSLTLVRYGRDGHRLNMLGRFPGPKRFLYRWPDGGFSVADVFFGRRTIVAVGASRRYIARNDHWEITAIASDGRSVQTIHRRFDVRPVEDRDVEEMTREILDAYSSADQRRRRRKVLRAAPRRDVLPVIEQGLVDREGYLWVENYRVPGAESTPRWSVFRPDGRWLGDVETPPGLRILEIGEDYVRASGETPWG